MSRLTNDIGFVQNAMMAALNSIFRDTFSVIAPDGADAIGGDIGGGPFESG